MIKGNKKRKSIKENFGQTYLDTNYGKRKDLSRLNVSWFVGLILSIHYEIIDV